MQNEIDDYAAVINNENVPHQVVQIGLATVFGALLNVIGVQIFKKKRLS